MIQIPPYIGTRKVGWWFLWPDVASTIATCPSKYHVSVTFAWVRASLSQPTSSQWSDIMAPHNNPVARTKMKHNSLLRCLFCKEIYDNFVYELMSEDMLDYIILSIIASHNILLLEMSFFFLRINRQWF